MLVNKCKEKWIELKTVYQYTEKTSPNTTTADTTCVQKFSNDFPAGQTCLLKVFRR